MADITMCRNYLCPMQSCCYRRTAKRRSVQPARAALSELLYVIKRGFYGTDRRITANASCYS